MNHRADEYTEEETRRLHVYISTFTVAGIVIGIILVVGAVQMRERTRRLRHSMLSLDSTRSTQEGPDQSTPQAAPSSTTTRAREDDSAFDETCWDEAAPRSDDGMEKQSEMEMTAAEEMVDLEAQVPSDGKDTIDTSML
ncbi:Aste57867_18130 [Aphanomyces stellatus]|uniref:Aste57867_18130 protein n=1 Tax=Aphanomyces stellatus TaxID=120398 RepID=A0A485L9J2_9STRA|nr:hypothetical protein As57867_018068 [Aphanomyces stellatus]VFT94868.1 Aste57867_18130 [Aphanomyces stellatus]